jgi:hypothetical protein
MNSTLAHAVHNHRTVTFWYDGLIRTVEPHTYGITTAGHEAVRGYQTGGFSRTTDRPGWRLYLLSDIRNLVAKGATFERTRPGYRSNDSRMTQIFAKA